MEIINLSELTDVDGKKHIDKNAFAPKFPFRYLICGTSSSGKTNMTVNLILKYIHFDKLYIYAKNLDQPIYRFLKQFFESAEEKIKKKLKLEDDDETIKIYHEFDTLEDVIPIEELDGETQKLVIFDDFNFNKNQAVVTEYFSRGRHKNVSSIYLAQSYFQTPKNVRINCNMFSFFNIPSSRDINLIISDLPIPVSKEKLKELFKTAMNKRYNFLTIDINAKILPMMIRRNFDELFIE